jgi:hypothetical protein
MNRRTTRHRLAPLGDRLREPSTWASLGGLAMAAGWQLAPGYAQAAAEVCALLGLLAGVFIPESRPPTE